jgi:hypothetical protein
MRLLIIYVLHADIIYNYKLLLFRYISSVLTFKHFLLYIETGDCSRFGCSGPPFVSYELILISHSFLISVWGATCNSSVTPTSLKYNSKHLDSLNGATE